MGQEGIPKFLSHPIGPGDAVGVTVLQGAGTPKKLVSLQQHSKEEMHGACDQELKWVVPVHLRQNNWGRGEKNNNNNNNKNRLESGTSEAIMRVRRQAFIISGLSAISLSHGEMVLGGPKTSRSIRIWKVLKMTWAAFLLKFLTQGWIKGSQSFLDFA